MTKKIFLFSVIFSLALSLALFCGVSKASAITLSASSQCLSEQAKVNLSWNAQTGATAYLVLRKEGQGEFITRNTLTGLTWQDTVESQKDYTYKIKAQTTGGDVYSNEKYMSASYCPPYLTGLSSCSGALPVVNLSWIFGLTNSSYYILRKEVGQEAFSQLNAISQSATNYLDTNIVSDKAYVYQIKAQKGSSYYYSNQITLPEKYCSPILQTPTTSCLADGPRINLSWQGVAGSISQYRLKRDGDLIYSGANLSFSDGPAIIAEQSYQYTVEAIWQNGHSEISAILPATAPACGVFLQPLNSNCLTESPGGPKINLSWNSLLGAINYQILRKTSAQGDFSLVAETTNTSFSDNLVNSLANDYWLNLGLTYKIKTIFETQQKDSFNAPQIVLPTCPPFLKIETVCSDPGDGDLDPEMRLSWSRTKSSILYNIFRNNLFRYQNSQPDLNTYIDYLNPNIDCLDKICSHDYLIQAILQTGDAIFSNSLTKSIDCSTVQAPAPAPTLNEPSAYCLPLGGGLYRPVVSLSWSPSNDVVSYGVYRNSEENPVSNTLSTSWQDNGVQSGYVYTYYLTAFGQQSTYVNSTNAKTITAVSCQVPSTPVLSLSGLCQAGLPFNQLTWQATTNTIKYEVYRGLTADNLTLQAVFQPGDDAFVNRQWNDLNINFSTNYFYKITAYGPTGLLSAPSLVVNVISSLCLPVAPVLLAPTQLACLGFSPQIQLNWTSSDLNTFSYEVFRQLSGGPDELLAVITNLSQKSFLDTTAIAGLTYNYRVDAVGLTSDKRTTQGQQAVFIEDCQPPGVFALGEPTVSCVDSALKVSNSWTASERAQSYTLIKNKLDSSNNILSTIETANVISPSVEWGHGNALSFYNDDYVAVGDISTANWTGLASEAWIYWTGQTKNSYAGVYYKSSSNDLGRLLILNNGQILVQNGNSNFWSLGAGDVPINKWTHIVYTYNKSLGKEYIFINGQQKGERGRGGDIAQNATNLWIGFGYANSSYYTFYGLIDEVRVYNRALLAGEALEHYQGTFSNEAGLIGLWHFDEGGTSQTVSDSSGLGNNGFRGSNANVEGADPVWVASGLQSAERYNWQAKAINFSGNTLSNLTTPVNMPVCYPTKPALRLTSFCQANKAVVELAWSFSHNADTIEVYQQGASSNPIATFNSSDPEFISRVWIDDNNGAGFTAGQNQTYWLKAISSSSLEKLSDQKTVAIALVCAPPTKPENLVASFQCDGSLPEVLLTWQASLNADYYTVYRVNNPASYETTALTLTNTYAQGVSVNSTFIYYVVAYGAGGISPSSNTAVIDTGYCPVSEPVINTLNTACQDDAPLNTIIWSDATTFNTNYYEIYRQKGADPEELVATIDTPAGQSSYQDDQGLVSNTSYQYTIKTIGLLALSEEISLPQSVDTLACGLTPATPVLSTSAVSCQNGRPKVSLTWPMTDPIAYSYGLFRKLSSESYSANASYPTVASPFSDQNGDYVLSFDGVNDYVDVGPDTAFDFNTTGQQFSLAVWVFPTSYTPDSNLGDSVFIAKDNGSGGSVPFYGIGMYQPNERLRVYYNGASINSGSYTISHNVWTYLVAVFDVGNDIKIYKNGVFWLSMPAGPASSANGGALTFGAHKRASSINGIYGGLLDEVRIYNRVLPATEVAEQYAGKFNNEVGLVGLWHFNEATGAIANDSSGNNNNGTIYGADWQIPYQEEQTTADFTGHALSFDGNDYVGTTNIFTNQNNTNWTISAWFKTTASGANQILYSEASSGYINFGVGVYLYVADNGKVGTGFYDGSAHLFETTESFNDGQWHHAVVVNNGPYTIYVDGVYKASWAGTIKSYGLNRVAIGAQRDNGLSDYFNGQIDDVRVYKRALSASEVLQEYSRNFVDDDQLFGFWKFDTGSGLVALDSSGNNNNGTISGASWTEPITISQKPNYSSHLFSNKTYNYKLQAYGPATESEFSTEKTITTGNCLPASPTLAIEEKCGPFHSSVSRLSWPAQAGPEKLYLYKNGGLREIVNNVNALSFDGVDDYVTYGPGIFTNQNNENWAISAWFKTTDTSGDYHYIFSEAAWGFCYEFLGINLIMDSSGHIGTGLRFGSWTESSFTATTYNDGNWHYATITRDDTTYYIYVDGLLRKTWIREAISIPIDRRSIGMHLEHSSCTGTRNFFNGLIDEVRVYNRFLSAEEIAEQYNGQFNNEDGLVALWRFNEGSGNIAIDSSDSGRNGSLIGPIRVVASPNGHYLGEIIFEDQQVSAGQNNSYYLVSHLGQELAGPSATVNSTVLDCSPADPNLQVTSECLDDTPYLALIWQADQLDQTQYWVLYRARDEEGEIFEEVCGDTLCKPPPDTLDYNDTDVQSGLTYKYYLQAVGFDDGQTITNSSIKSATAGFCYPTPPTPVLEEPVSTCAGYTAKINLTWQQTDPEAITTSFNVWRKKVLPIEEAESQFSKITISGLSPLASSYSDGVVEDKTFVYKIEAVGQSQSSNSFSDESVPVASLACSSLPPFKPVILPSTTAYVNVAPFKVRLYWTDAGNETGYTVYRKCISGSSCACSAPKLWQKMFSLLFGSQTAYAQVGYSPIISLGEDVQGYDDYTIFEDTSYSYIIEATNDNGTASSDPFEIDVPPAPPGNFNLRTSWGDNKVYLEWDIPTSGVGPFSYSVQRSRVFAFTSPDDVCDNDDVACDGSKCYCYDTSPVFSKKWYRASATNAGGTTFSNIAPVQFPAPTFREVSP